MTLAEQVGLLRRALHRRLTQRLALRTSRPFEQLRALSAVERQQASTQGELARRLLIDAPAASRLVRQLERDGLLTRRAGRDRRCLRLALTRKGRGELGLLRSELEAFDREVRRHLTAGEAKALAALAGKLEAVLSADEASERNAG